MATTLHTYRGFRLPAEMIGHAMCLSQSFSLRDVEFILAAHGVVMSYESI